MGFKRIRKKKGGPPIKSTLDIINKKEGDVLASHLEARANTGDVLLYCNDMTEADDWYHVCLAGQGKVGLERRLPVIHIGVVVQNPPLEILQEYGLESDPDCTTYVFEGRSSKPTPRLVRVREWIQHEYDYGKTSGHHLFWRKRKVPSKVEPTEDFWQWLKEAKALPYPDQWYMKELWEGFFFMFVLNGRSAFWAMISILAQLTRKVLLESLGPGRVRQCLADMVGFLTRFLLFLCFFLCLVYFGIPLLFHRASTRLFQKDHGTTPYTKGYGVKADGSLKFIICSVAAGETIRRLQLLDEKKAHPSFFLPKDFLPEGVGGSGNLFDFSLKPGVVYDDHLTRVANPYGPPARRQFSPSIFVATGQAKKALRTTLIRARDALSYDLHCNMRDVSGSERLKKSGLLKHSVLARQSVFVEEPLVEEPVGEPSTIKEKLEPVKEEEAKKED